MRPVKKLKFERTVVAVSVTEDREMVISDLNTTIVSLEMDTFDIKNQLKSNIIHPSYMNSVVAFSSDATYMALVAAGAKESRLYNIKDKKLVGRVSRHQGDVSCVAIDPKSRYMFSGGDDGIIFAVDIMSGQSAFTLPRHIDTINDIAFSQNANLVATAGFDKEISLFDLITMTPICRLRAHSNPVVKLLFLSKNRLLSIDKGATALIWDLDTKSIVSRISGIHDDVTKVAIDDISKFLFMGTKLGYIIVYNLDDYSFISQKYIKLTNPITALTFDSFSKQLIIAQEDGEVLIYDIFQYQDLIQEALLSKKYELIEDYIDKNPLLLYTSPYIEFQTIWDKTVLRAIELIESKNIQKAQEIFKNFMGIASKKQAARKIFEKYKDYEKFVTLIQQNKLALAYAMANSNPHYKETKAYKNMEGDWNKRVMIAQKYLLTPNNENKIQEIFSLYRGISEKTLIIQDLIKNAKVYTLFKKVVAQKEFKSIFELTKRYPFLRESSEYRVLLKYSDSIYIKAAKLTQDGEFHAAIKLYRELLEFDDFKEEAKKTLDEIELKQKFFSAIKEGDYIGAYVALDSSYKLQATDEGKKLEQEWERDYEAASKFASKADVDSVIAAISKYVNISTKQTAIATIISWCYINQLNYALFKKMEQKKIENGIKNYISFFGLTDQIVTYFDTFKKEYVETKLNLEAQTQGSMQGWRAQMAVKSILN